MRPVDIFIAYSHNDLTHKNELKKFLRPLLNTGLARLWDDHEIEGGQDWEAEIKKRLYGADIILLLVSPDSLASEYFYGQELKVSLERHEKGEAAVVPIVIRPCPWTITPLKRLEALPEKGKPVTSWASQDEAYTDVAHKIGNIVESRQALIAAASEQEDIRRDFVAAVETAEHLFYKQQWTEAQKVFHTALQFYRPGFSPDRATLENRRAACADELRKAGEAEVWETRRKEYESLLAAADGTEDRKEIARSLQRAIQLYQSGFPGNVADLQQRLYAAQAKTRVVPAPEPGQVSNSLKLTILSVFAILILAFGTWFLTRPPGSNRSTQSKQPTQQETPSVAVPADWRKATTAAELYQWLNQNRNADPKDRAGVNERLQTFLRKRTRDLKDAKVYLKAKDYEEAKVIIDGILKEYPKDVDAQRLKDELPEKYKN